MSIKHWWPNPPAPEETNGSGNSGLIFSDYDQSNDRDTKERMLSQSATRVSPLHTLPLSDRVKKN